MSGIVIQDHMDVFPLGDLSLNESQKLEEFLMAMPGLTLADHSLFGHIKSSKKTGGSIPLIIMGVPFHLPGPKGQHWLSPYLEPESGSFRQPKAPMHSPEGGDAIQQCQ